MTRSVVILGFPGVQPLDLVGPHDVFAGAALLTEGGYTVSVVAPTAGPSPPDRAGLRRPADARPDTIDTLVLPGGAGSTPCGRTRRPWPGSAPRQPPPAASSASAPAHSWPPRPACSTATAPPRTGPSPTGWRGSSRPSPSTRSRSSCAVRRRCGPPRASPPASTCAGPGRGGLRHRGRPDRGPLAGAVPAPPGRADPVRRAGVDAARPPRTDPRGAGVHRGRTRCPHSIPDLARRGDEPAAFHPGVHRRGRRGPRPTSNASAPRPPGANCRRPTTPSSPSPPAAASAPRRPCAATSFAASGCRPTSTAERSPRLRGEKK